jgi:uncharacterized membrane protein YdcZ (DUF606 family)
MKRIAGKIFLWIGNGLLAIAAIVIGASLLFGWYNYGFGWVQETLSPFNVWNVIATLIVLAPGIGFRMAGEKLLESARPNDDSQ